MKTSFTEEQAVALMSFVNDNGWCEDARAAQILLSFEFLVLQNCCGTIPAKMEAMSAAIMMAETGRSTSRVS
jgi:hypothetical protein